jgi:predicted MFS family arabinose efflux permease
VAGYLTEYINSQFAFLGLAAIGTASVMVAWALMPETRPTPERERLAPAVV